MTGRPAGRVANVGIFFAGLAFLAYAFWAYREGGRRSGVYFWATVVGSAVAGLVCAVAGVVMMT
jgi:hypothetical protein